ILFNLSFRDEDSLGDSRLLLQYSVSFLLSCWFCIAERFNVVGPDAPLVAEAGEDLVLPCSLQPNISAEGMMVEWLRTDLTDGLVHLYKDYKDTNDDQIKTYRGRTALFKEELKKGNTSLKLSALQPSDEGSYKCFSCYFVPFFLKKPFLCV
uniref:Ig-like domain-containing protein n=1 Tax=Astyanax mexicanus TaxID=7994 RepID=A0A3B1K2L8_ASTMX